ncbi:MAG: hypothetical protein QXN20_07545 [Candidatus Bathyarchaeia archaeon]
MVTVEELVREFTPLHYQVIARLKRQPMDEEEIIRMFKKQFGEAWKLPDDLLKSLEAKGIIEMQLKEGKKIYFLTERGQSVPLYLNLYR